MGGCFYVVLNMSITASLIGLLVTAARLPLRGRASFAAYALWAVVAVRLVLPFSVPSEASVYNFLSRFLYPVLSVPAGDYRSFTMTNSIGAANAYFPLHFRTDALATAFDTAGTVWLAGALLCLAVYAALYTLTARRLGRALPSAQSALFAECARSLGVRRKVRLRVTDEISSPVVFGLYSPAVFIPAALENDPETMRYVLLHELVHIRRGDNAIRVLSAALSCIHWFNPLAWLFLALSGRDMERACDAGAVKELTEDGRKAYARALLSIAAGRPPTLAAAFGGGAVRARIFGILKYRRLTAAAAALVGCLLFVLAVVLLTNPAS